MVPAIFAHSGKNNYTETKVEIYHRFGNIMAHKPIYIKYNRYDMHMVSIRVRYGFRWHSDKPYRTSRRQAISNESKTSSIWLVRVPSKPISHENRYHMHFLARNNHKFKLHNKETHNWNITTTSTNHRVRYGVRLELCLTLQHNQARVYIYIPIFYTDKYLCFHELVYIISLIRHYMFTWQTICHHINFKRASSFSFKLFCKTKLHLNKL